jgi:hypothetical protein
MSNVLLIVLDNTTPGPCTLSFGVFLPSPALYQLMKRVVGSENKPSVQLLAQYYKLLAEETKSVDRVDADHCNVLPCQCAMTAMYTPGQEAFYVAQAAAAEQTAAAAADAAIETL